MWKKCTTMSIHDHSKKLNNAFRGLDKAQRMNEFKKGIRMSTAHADNGKGWRATGKLDKALYARITLPFITMERKKENRKVFGV